MSCVVPTRITSGLAAIAGPAEGASAAVPRPTAATSRSARVVKDGRIEILPPGPSVGRGCPWDSGLRIAPAAYPRQVAHGARVTGRLELCTALARFHGPFGPKRPAWERFSATRRDDLVD